VAVVSWHSWGPKTPNSEDEKSLFFKRTQRNHNPAEFTNK